MQKPNFTGKGRFVVSNRVFWAAVVLTAAALLGRDAGRAAPDEIKARKISAQLIEVSDGSGKSTVHIFASPNGAIVDLLSNGQNEKLGLVASAKGGPNIVFTTKGKARRIVNAEGSAGQ